MSLDQNLFTLNVTPSTTDLDVVDLVDPAGTIHYRKRRAHGETYKVEVSGMSSSLDSHTAESVVHTSADVAVLAS